MAKTNSPLSSFLEYSTKSRTYQSRFTSLTARMLESTNRGLNLLFEEKEAICEMGIMSEIAEVFREQSIVIEEMVENNANELRAHSEYMREMSKIIERIASE